MASSSVSEPAKKPIEKLKGELEKLEGKLEKLEGKLEKLKGERKELESKRDKAHAAANSAALTKDKQYEENKEKDATAQIDSTTALIDSTTALVITITKKMTGDIQGIGESHLSSPLLSSPLLSSPLLRYSRSSSHSNNTCTTTSPSPSVTTDSLASDMASLQLATANARADKECADKEAVILQYRVRELEGQLSRNVHTTTRLLEQHSSTVAGYFDNATTFDFWLPDVTTHRWADRQAWEKFNKQDASVGELSHVQPMFSSGGALFDNFPKGSSWQIVDSHASNVLGMTHDITLYLKSAIGSALGIGAVVELTGHSDSVKDYPSVDHKSKFIRDLLRVRSKSGGNRVVHGCVTDLARIVVVRLNGIGQDGTPILHKTAVLTGDDVRRVLTAFAFADPSSVGVNVVTYDVVMEEHNDDEDAVSVTVAPIQQLGRGAQGRVFEVQSTAANPSPSLFLKVLTAADGFEREVAALRALKVASAPFVPCILGVNASQSPFNFLASPVCQEIPGDASLQVVLPLIVQLVDCLKAAHGAGYVHRDVRPSNIVMRVGADHLPEVVLVDWACATRSGRGAVYYEGTVHYAATDILELLATNRDAEISPIPEHDLESLVYAVFDWTRRLSRPPLAKTCKKDAYGEIAAAWKKDIFSDETNCVHAQRLEFARKRQYENLKESFKL